MLQALGAAALVPASLAIILSVFPAEKVPAAVAVWGAIAALAAAVLHRGPGGHAHGEGAHVDAALLGQLADLGAQGQGDAARLLPLLLRAQQRGQAGAAAEQAGAQATEALGGYAGSRRTTKRYGG